MPIHHESTSKFSQAICQINGPPQASLRRQVLLHFEALMRLKNKGFTYASLSVEMKSQGIVISPNTLKKYLEFGLRERRERKRRRKERQHEERYKEESPPLRRKTQPTNSGPPAVVPINFGAKGFLEIVPDAPK